MDHNTSFDLNSSERGDINGTNWFYYRDFLTGMDTVYKYGTNAMIVIGSGIDYSLYWLTGDDNTTEQTDINLTVSEDNNITAVLGEATSNDENITEQTDVNLTVSEDNNITAVLSEPLSNENNKSVQEFVSSLEGKTDLPEQLASHNKRKGERTYLMSQWFDEETINDGFLDVTNHSYLRLRGGYAYDQKGENKYIYSIAARVKIPRTRDRLDLVVGDDTRHSSDLSFEGTDEERDNSIALGVNNVFGIFDAIDSKMRLGFSGITNPYGKVAFGYEALLGKWLIKPSQTFRYSLDDEFEEWTNLEFKRRIYSNAMFSLLFQRSTESRVKGMDYFMQPALSFALGEYGNLTPYLGLYGRTKKQPEDEDGYMPKRGVYHYAAGISWSKQSSRKYIVYRLQPILSYNDKYDFHLNYFVKVMLEFYFGLRD